MGFKCETLLSGNKGRMPTANSDYCETVSMSQNWNVLECSGRLHNKFTTKYVTRLHLDPLDGHVGKQMVNKLLLAAAHQIVKLNVAYYDGI